MTPQEIIAANPCVACLSEGEQEAIITASALAWLEYSGGAGGAPVEVSLLAQDAMDDSACVVCLSAHEQRTIKTVAALSQWQWIEDNS